jgi:hypothetical protein
MPILIDPQRPARDSRIEFVALSWKQIGESEALNDPGDNLRSQLEPHHVLQFGLCLILHARVKK